MSGRLSEVPDVLSGGDGGDSGPLLDLLDEGEHARHVLAGDSVEHVTEGRTTTLTPEGGHDAYLIVTDERVLVVLGDQPDVVEIEFHLVAISQCEFKSGLLRSTLVVGHDDERVRISPSGGDPQAIADDIALLSDVYREVESSLASAADRTERLIEHVREQGTEGDHRLRVQSRLSEARHHATREDTAPSDRLLERIDDRTAEFDRRYVDAWLDRGETELTAAEEAFAEDDHEAFCTAYTTTVGAVASIRDALEDLADPPEGSLERVETLAERTDELEGTYVESTRNAYEVAEDSNDSGTVATHWLETYRRLSAARAADWNAIDGSADLPVDEIESVASATVESLERHASDLEGTGEDVLDDDAEEASARFERAADRIRLARDIAGEWSAIEDGDYEARLEALEKQVSVVEWEWGTN